MGVLLAVSLLPPDAWAKGSTLRFERESYEPGDRAVAHAVVETWPSSGQPEDGPYTVYLVRFGPLWYGHLPPGAPRVGKLRIGQQLPDRAEVGDTYRVSVAFDVPRVSSGRYHTWVCAPGKGGKGCWIGFGDLVYGKLVVRRSAEATAQADPLPGERNPTVMQDSVTIPWDALGFALLGAVATAMALLISRRGRTSG